MYNQIFELIVTVAIATLAVVLIAVIYYFLTFKTCIMGKIEDLETALDDQATAIAAEKAQVVAILEQQNENIAALEEQVANGGSSEQLQALINKIKENTAALKKIYEAPGEDTGDGGDAAATGDEAAKA